jgi:hypothetical protein
MRTATKLTVAALVIVCSAGWSTAQTTATSSGCKVVHLKAGENPPAGAMTSSVTAGGGKVSGSTTGGNSVTVHSGNGSSSSVATTGSSGGGSSVTTVTTGDGKCTTYIRDKS